MARRRMISRLAGGLLAASLTLAGCDESVESPPPTGESAAQLGEGLFAEDGTMLWSSFDDDPTVKVTYGLQGGYHLELAARFWGVNPEGISLTFDVIDPETGESLVYPTRHILSADRTDCFDEGYCERLGIRAVFDMPSSADPEVSLLGKEIKVVLTLDQPLGQSHTDEHTVRVDEVGW